jgi:hypothetical protein
MIKILKRTGKTVDFNRKKIENAIMKAMKETPEGVDEELAASISAEIEAILQESQDAVPVEFIQDLVDKSIFEFLFFFDLWIIFAFDTYEDSLSLSLYFVFFDHYLGLDHLLFHLFLSLHI